jgi:hypothetical protein
MNRYETEHLNGRPHGPSLLFSSLGCGWVDVCCGVVVVLAAGAEVGVSFALPLLVVAAVVVGSAVLGSCLSFRPCSHWKLTLATAS